MTEKKEKTSKISGVDKKIKVIEKLAKELVKHLGLVANVKVGSENNEAINVQLESEDQGILIGYHGENLFSFQLILTMMAYRQIGEWVRVLVNIGDYRERRQKSLERIALSAAQKAKFANEPQALPPMSPPERRLIHLALANDGEVSTESEGEGRYRRVIVKPNK